MWHREADLTFLCGPRWVGSSSEEPGQLSEPVWEPQELDLGISEHHPCGQGKQQIRQ